MCFNLAKKLIYILHYAGIIYSFYIETLERAYIIIIVNW